MIRISNVERFPYYRFTDTETGQEIKDVLTFTINTPEPGGITTATLTVLAQIDVIVDGDIKKTVWTGAVEITDAEPIETGGQ